LKIVLFILFLFSPSLSNSQDLVRLNNLEEIEKIKDDFSGNVLVFNFWATWCKTCIEEFPDLIKIRNTFINNDFKLILISLDFKEDIDSKLFPFLKINEVDFTTYYLDVRNPDEIINYFDKKWDGGIPATFIFDKEGNLQKFILGKNKYDFFEKEIIRLL
jgi:thiol-disulfide isomerase/thioredoxin